MRNTATSSGFNLANVRDQSRPKLSVRLLGHMLWEAPPLIAESLVAEHRPNQQVFEENVQVRAMREKDIATSILRMDEVDMPPRLLSELAFDSETPPDAAGFVINFRIAVRADGRPQYVDITSNWLDEASTALLVEQLMAATYAPARRLGLPVNGLLEGGLGLNPQEDGPANAGPVISLSPTR